jgi:predicted MPP superfamily phosphohydrolase
MERVVGMNGNRGNTQVKADDGGPAPMMIGFFLLFVLVVISAMTLYTSLIMDAALNTGSRINRMIYLIPVTLSWITIGIYILAHFHHRGLMIIPYLFATLWTGLIFFGFSFAIIGGVLELVILIIPGSNDLLSCFLRILMIFGPASVFVISIINARILRTRRLRITVRSLNRPIRIAFFSDLHLGLLVGKRRLGKIIRIFRRSQPDIIIAGGDIFDTKPRNLDFLSMLKEFVKIAPVYAVTGNHEYLNDVKACVDSMEDAGFRMLRWENTRDDTTGLVLCGVDDPTGVSQFREWGKDLSVAIPPVSGDRPTILISHQPIGFKHASELGVDLMISGHTHGGQIEPFGIATRLFFKDGDRGLKRRNGSRLYISKGSGTWGPPMRFGTSSEIVLIDLIPSRKRAEQGSASM